jgi:hypothetical protein
VNLRGDAWGAWGALGLKGKLVVVLLLAFLVALVYWLDDRRDASTSCGALEAMVERVDGGEQGAFSEQRLADAEAISIKGMGRQEPAMVNVATALSVAVITARRDHSTAAVGSAVTRYAAVCGVELPSPSPWGAAR